MSHRKGSQKGRSEREAVLALAEPNTPAIVEYPIRKYTRKEVQTTDVLDALVAAVTALNSEEGLESIPEAPEWDAKGLPMEMVY